MSEKTPPLRQRLDKWLWFTRVVKTRTMAAKLVLDGHVRVNGTKADAASKQVATADIITIALERNVKILRVIAPGSRRGPYVEACLLYTDLTPPSEPHEPGQVAQAHRDTGDGRPTKRDRRQMDRLRDTGD